MKKIIIAALVSASFAIAAPMAISQNQAVALQGQARTDAIAKINASINAMDNIEGNFTQYASGNNFTNGKFWLDRPGKMRFEYDAPSKLLLVSDGSNVYVNDRRLKTVERYPLRSTPLYFLLKSNVDINNELKITSVVNVYNKTVINVRDKKNEAQGELIMVFGSDNKLEEWTIKDNRKRITHVTLKNVKVSSAKPNDFFRVKDLPKTAGGKGGM